MGQGLRGEVCPEQPCLLEMGDLENPYEIAEGEVCEQGRTLHGHHVLPVIMEWGAGSWSFPQGPGKE